MVITDLRTQTEILSEMVRDLTSNMSKEEQNDFTRKWFDKVIGEKFDKGRFPVMKTEITIQ